MLGRQIIQSVASFLGTILIAGLITATLVRFAPGFGIDERETDARLNGQSIEYLRQAQARNRQVIPFYGRYLIGLLKGGLGNSQSLSRPVAELFAERIPTTARGVGTGLAGGWILGLGLALMASVMQRGAVDFSATALSSFLLCVPSSTIALFLLIVNRSGDRAGWAAAVAVCLVVFPRIFRFARGILAQNFAMPYVLMARARGLHAWRILFSHVLMPAAPSIVAVLGVSVSVAFGAAIPVEVICDSPGLGQLAWQAALQRDLPLLVNITLLVTVVTVAANSTSAIARAAMGGQSL